MIDPRFRLVAELIMADGTSARNCAIAPDWYPAEESLRFRGLRQNRNLSDAKVRIDPLWDAKGPFVRGVQMTLCAGDGPEISAELPITYFRGQVRSAASETLDEKRFDGASLNYRIAAYPLNETASESSDQVPLLTVREIISPPANGERALPHFLRSARLIDEPSPQEMDDHPVFVPLSVLEQAEELKILAKENETGGILIGHLWKDTNSPELFTEVTALIPAQYTLANSTSLTFVPETWEAVRSAIRLRGRDEVFVGWHHTHPSRFWCHCDANAQRHCPLGKQFFSVDDIAVHRTIFSKAHHLALVTGDRPLSEGGWEMIHSLYGWRNGSVEPRGFYVLEGDKAESASALPKQSE